MVFMIDMIDFDGDDEIDIRGWICMFVDFGKLIYVGIYTSFCYEDCGYVSVGFFILSVNFIVTLLLCNHDGDDLLLILCSDLLFLGYYLSVVDGECDALIVVKLFVFHE